MKKLIKPNKLGNQLLAYIEKNTMVNGNVFNEKELAAAKRLVKNKLVTQNGNSFIWKP